MNKLKKIITFITLYFFLFNNFWVFAIDEISNLENTNNFWRNSKEIKTFTWTIMYLWNNLNSIDNVVLYIRGKSWKKTLYTNNWYFSFTWFLNEKYYVNFDSPLKYYTWWKILTSSYMTEDKTYNINLDDNKNIVFNTQNNNSTEDFISLTWTINWLNWKNVIFWSNNWISQTEENLWTLNDDNYIFNVRVNKNLWITRIWIKPVEWDQSWNNIEKKEIEIKDISIWWLNFNPIKNLKNLDVTVKDNKWNFLSWAIVSVYIPWKSLFTSTTRYNWIANFNIPTGQYSYKAKYKSLDYSIEKQINLKNNSEREIKINKPDFEVSWTVYFDWTEQKNVSLTAKKNNTILTTNTDENWNYLFFLDKWKRKINWTYNDYTINELILNNLDSNLNQQNLVFNNELQTLTWSVKLNWNWVSWVNISALSNSWISYYTTTNNSWDYILNLNNWDYKIKAFSNIYKFIWEQEISIWNSNTPVDFTINSTKNITVNFVWDWINNNSDFKWSFDLWSNNYTKTITGFTWSTFKDIQWNRDYNIKINIDWIWNIYNTWLYLDDDKVLEVNIPSQQKIITLTWVVYESWTTNLLEDSVITFINSKNKQSISLKTDDNWIYSLTTSIWNTFDIIWKKNWYNNSNLLTWITINENSQLPNLYLEKIIWTINITWNITNNLLNDSKIFVSLKWLNNNNEETSKWYWKELLLSWSIFILDWVPSDFWSWKIIISADWYEKFKDIKRNFNNSDINLWNLTLIEREIKEPKFMHITPALWWFFDDTWLQTKVMLPSNALWNWLDLVNLQVKETSLLPFMPWTEAVNWKAKEITTTDFNWNPITNFSNDINIELNYSWSEFYETQNWITIWEIKNMQISYFDVSSSSWMALPTVTTSSDWTLFDNYSDSTLLSSINWYENIVFTLKSTTDHFTIFTALISSAVSNSTTISTNSTPNSNTSNISTNSWWWWGWWSSSSTKNVSIISWILATKNNITSYLWNTSQSIKLLVWNNINDILTIERNWKKININDALKDAGKTFSSIASNAVDFWVWDVISTTKNWSLSISIDWYTNINLANNSKFEIKEVWNNFLTYDNILWKIKYDFDHRNDKEFTYKVKWKTSYATIRWTIVEVESDSNKDIYNLIKWKIDVYNDKLKKTTKMIEWDKLIVYANWSEDNSWVKLLTNSLENKLSDYKINWSTWSKKEILVDKKIVWEKINLWNKVRFKYDDVNEKNWYFKYVNTLNSEWVIANNSNFYPENNISRIELLKMLSISAWINWFYNEKYTFEDVKDKNYWWTKYVCSAKKLNYISSNNYFFRPLENITREEALKMILNFKKANINYDEKYTFEDVKKEDWSAKYISSWAKLWIISNSNKYFNPKTKITRSEVAKMVYSAFYNK